MLGNISILTEDQLDEAVDRLVEAIQEHIDTYDYVVDDINDAFVIQVADEIDVNPTPQVIDVVLYRVRVINE
jgi:hypothetical protein